MNNNTSSSQKIMRVVVIGLMAALVFVSTKIGFDIPVGVGGKTHIHLGNTLCLLSGLLFGGLAGGIASGTGSMMVDLLDPVWISGAPITLINKFIMGFVCGKIAHRKKAGLINDWKNTFIAALAGQLVYMVLYLGKSFLSVMLLGGENAMQTALAALIPRLASSSINAIIAVSLAVPLSFAVRKALTRSNVLAGVLPR